MGDVANRPVLPLAIPAFLPYIPQEEGIAMEQLDRITLNPEVMGGKACIRGMRVTVSMIVSQIAAGQSVESLLEDFPYLEREDITQALQYAAWRASEREVILARA